MPRLVNLSSETTTTMLPVSVAEQINTTVEAHKSNLLWQGPGATGHNGGVTQSMLGRYLCCRERFRIKYVLGLSPSRTWDKKSGYGDMWHVCEEAHAKRDASWQFPERQHRWQEELTEHTNEQMRLFPMQRQDIARWDSICRVQFPEYVKYWSQHTDVLDRVPLMQEQVFDVWYKLPSGRRARLRGKLDSVDLIPSQGGIFQQENKTKGDIDEANLRRQLSFDLQTMYYHVALERMRATKTTPLDSDTPICGVRYNVVRRPFSGGKGSIQQHKAKVKKGRVYKTKPSTPDELVPGETDEEFYERLRRDYIAAEPDYWFFRVMCRVTSHDVTIFKRQFLDPVLENLLDDYEWWEWCFRKNEDHWDYELRSNVFPTHTQRCFRFPFGVYNAMTEVGYTEYDEYLGHGIDTNLRRSDVLFPELKGETCQPCREE